MTKQFPSTGDIAVGVHSNNLRHVEHKKFMESLKKLPHADAPQKSRKGSLTTLCLYR